MKTYFGPKIVAISACKGNIAIFVPCGENTILLVIDMYIDVHISYFEVHNSNL